MKKRRRRMSQVSCCSSQSSSAYRTITLYAEYCRYLYTINFLNNWNRPITYRNFTDIVPILIPHEQFESIIIEGIDYAKQKKLDIKSIIGNYESGLDESSEIIESLYRNAKIRSRIIEIIRVELNKLIKQYSPAELKDSCPNYNRLREVKSLFGLSEIDLDILYLVFNYSIDSSIGTIADVIENVSGVKKVLNQHRPGSTPNPAFLAFMLPYSRIEISKALSNKSPLLRFNLIQDIDYLADDLSFYISGLSDKALHETYVREYTGESLPVESLLIPEEDRLVLEQLISSRDKNKSLNILLYGEPGTGKTEFARSLAGHMNHKVLEVWSSLNNSNDKDSAYNFRFRSTVAADRLYKDTDTVLIIDEADDLLNASGGGFLGMGQDNNKKALINETLEEGSLCRFWITNHSHGIDPSTLRRFDYAIKFEPFSQQQRVNVWKSSVKKHSCENIFTDDDISRLADRFSVNAGGIDIAMRNIKPAIAKGMEQNKIVQFTERLLSSHEKTLGINSFKKKNNEANSAKYDLEGLNIIGGHEQPLMILDEFSRYWNDNKDGAMSIRNMNVLLYGPPGSGKSEFSKFISRHLKRKLIVRSATDFYNMYHGESEKRINEAFRAAEREKAILMIDEADGLIRPRESAQNSWEIPIINEFLTCMENFTGILICTTNFHKGLDNAAIRRFNIKLGFEYLTTEGIRKFYKRIIEPEVEGLPTAEEYFQLENIKNLTPGDFKVVYQQFAFFNKKDRQHKLFIDALETESKNKHYIPKSGMGFHV
ncbi:MAG: ATP-binding protein [Fibrobacteres bacterium]|nr:ATP-binding protein [Fibrobacterota bacterium]